MRDAEEPNQQKPFQHGELLSSTAHYIEPHSY